MFICWCCLVNIQVERDKDVHMIPCLVNIQVERGKDVHMISCLVNIKVEGSRDVHRMVVFGECTSRERQRCSYVGAVW